ncbi:MAG: DNA-binding response regulator [Chloroflexi bacterium]|nr:MAG: DNA-binding response regulator [Chloroflexota bacterium]
MMHVIVIAENEENRNVLSFVLRNAGLTVARSANVNLVTKSLLESPAELLVIAPDTTVQAIEDVKALRAVSQAPMLVLVENLPESEHCQLLDAGADLVMKRPFSSRVLVRYVRMFLRRAGNIPMSVLSTVSAGDVTLEPGTRTVHLPDKDAQHLTLLEFRLLYILMTNLNQVIPIDVIVERVWGYEGQGNRELVRGLVRRLRRKIEPNPKVPIYIQNLPGIGYRFEEG